MLFAFSGGLALAYEVLWTRLLALLVGHTTYGLTTVLAATMAGLGLGGLWGGRLAGRIRNPLRAYALLEAGIGATGVALGPLLLALEPIFGAAYRAAPDSPVLLACLRFALCGALLFVPTALMGMTLPVLAALATRRDHVGGDVGVLYGANTLGAAGGALMAGLVLLPSLGIRGTALAAATLNLLVAAIAAGMSLAVRGPAAPSVPQRLSPVSETATPLSLPAWGAATALGAAAVAAAGAMIQQVAWVRAIGLSIGSTTDAFTLIVAVFILGLALGAAGFGWLADRIGDPFWLLGITLVGGGLASVAILPLLGSLPLRVAGEIRDAHGDHATVLAAVALRVGIYFLLPTVLMGGAFPIVTRILAGSARGIGFTVGRAYAASTIGSIGGAVLAGFVLVPGLGCRGASLSGAAAALAAGFLLLALRPLDRIPHARWLRAAEVAGGALAGIALLTFLPAWDPAVVNSGPYVNTARFLEESERSGESLETIIRSLRVAWWDEGVDGTVAVLFGPEGQRSLMVNGKPDASSEGDQVTQALLAHLPLALHPRPESILVIGLGGGMTAGSAALHPLQRIAIAEISQTVVDAARNFFSDVNRRVLEDPRTRVLLGDARTTVGQARQRYDVITSEPSNLYMAGVPELFTVEFFRLCRARLNPGGVMCQWIHAYNLTPEDFKMVVRTFAAVFPGVSLWDAHLGSDFLLIGTLDGEGAPPVAYKRLAELFADPGIAADLAAIGTREPAELLGWFVAEGDALRRFAGPGPVNTVDRNRLEFSVPRAMRLGPGLDIYTGIDPLRHREPFAWVEGILTPEIIARANARRRDAKLYGETQANAFLGDAPAALDSYHQIEGRDGSVAWGQARFALYRLAWNLLLGGDAPGALRVATDLVAEAAGDVDLLQLQAEAAHRSGDAAAARHALEGVLAASADPTTRAWAEENLRRMGDEK